MNTNRSFLYRSGKAGVPVLMLLLFLAGCGKDGDKITLVPPQSGAALTASATNFVLENAKADENALTLEWAPVSYGYTGQVVQYRLQLDKKGGDFSKGAQLDMGDALKKTFSHAELNRLLVNLGLVAGQSSGIAARVVAGIGATASAAAYDVASPALEMTGTPYFAVRVYPSLRVPGAHQGWKPETAPIVASVKDDGRYEGYVHFTAAGQEFKLTTRPDWSGTNYGEAGAGKLSADGGAGNLKSGPAGYYLLKADLNTLTYTVTGTTWGVIGDATPSGWDADQPLAYDADNGTWQLTLQLKAGEMKFRANKDWTLNYGDKDGDGLLEEGGDNIKVKEAGSYLLVLDLSRGAGNYTYSLRKQ